MVAAFQRPLVDVEWLRAHLGEPALAVVDCRWALGDPGAGERAWREGHIPGAAFLDVDRDLASEPGERGRHPLPEASRFQAAARRAGIGRTTRVVAYDEAGEGGAARLWWLMRHFGHDEVAVLDGGLRAWREAGGAIEAGALREGGQRDRAGHSTAGAADFEARPRADDTVDAEDLAAAFAAGGPPGPAGARTAADAVLLDARAPERFRGELEPIDQVAGHIPGALNLPFAELAPEGRFPDAAELRERIGDRPFVAYCGSGITACVLLLAGEVAGVEGRLYPGSWSEWSRRGLPVETGPPAG